MRPDAPPGMPGRRIRWLVGVLLSSLFASVPSSWAADAGVEFGAEDDLTVIGTGGTNADADFEARGYSVFGSGASAALVTSGAGNLYVQNNLELGGTAYLAALGIGTAGAPATALEIRNNNATANAVVDLVTLTKETSGTPAAGLGAGLVFRLEDLGGAEEQARLDAVLTNAADGAEQADLVFSVQRNGAISELMRLIGNTATLQLGAPGYDGTLVLYNELGLTDYTVQFTPSGTQGANIAYTLPANDGTADGQALLTDGSGVLRWGTASASSVPLSGVTAATAGNLIDSGANGQIWQWALGGSGETGLTLGESTAASSGGTLLGLTTLGSSTAIPLHIRNSGDALSLQVDDAAADTTPFVIDAAGLVGIGTATPGSDLDILSNDNTNAHRTVQIDRPNSTNYESTIEFATANSLQWWLGMDNDGTNTLYLGKSGPSYVQTWDTNGEVGIATTAPDLALEVNSATGNNLRLTYNDANGSAVNYADFLISSAGALTIAPSRGDLYFTDGTNPLLTLYDAGTYGLLKLSDKGSTGDPAACTAGEIYFNATDATVKACTAANTWEALDAAATNTAWTDIGDATGATVIGLGANTTQFDFTGDTTVGWTYNADSVTTGIGQLLSADGLTSGTGMSLVSTSTAGDNLGNSKLLNVLRSGANANASHTAYGLYSAVTNTGTTSTNVGGYFSATGASNNYGLIVENGNVGIGTTTPDWRLKIDGGANGDASIYVKSGSGQPGYLRADSVNNNTGVAMYENGTPQAYMYWDATANKLRFFESSATQMAISGGLVGIGTDGPDKELEINSATGNNLRLTYNDADGSAASYTDLTTGTDGSLTIGVSGTSVATFNKPAAAGSSTDSVKLSPTFNAMDTGGDISAVLTIDPADTAHASGGLYGINLPSPGNNGSAQEFGIVIAAGWTEGIYSSSPALFTYGDVEIRHPDGQHSNPALLITNSDVTNDTPGIRIDMTETGGAPLVLTPLSAAPTTVAEGALYYDSDDDNLYVYANGGWVDMTVQGGSVNWDAIGDPTGANVINLAANTTQFDFTGTTTDAWTLNANSLTNGRGFVLNANGLTSGTAMRVVSTSTAGTGSASHYMLSVLSQGANANASHTSYGILSEATNTGTTSTNVGGYFSASGATNNYGLLVPSGSVGIGTATPNRPLHVFSASSGGAVVKIEEPSPRLDWLESDGTADNKLWRMFGNNEQWGISAVTDDTTGTTTILTVDRTGTAIDTVAFPNASSVVIGDTAAAADRLEVYTANASTNTVQNVLRLNRSSSAGVGASGLGAALDVYLENSLGANYHQAARMDVVWEDALDTSEDASLRFNAMRAGSLVELARLDGTTGTLQLGSNGVDGGLVLFNELGGTDYTVTFGTSGTQGANIAYTLPPDDGDAGEQLQTNGSGLLTWEPAGSTTWNAIGAPTAGQALSMAGFTSTWTSTLDDATAGTESVLKIDNTDADLANDTALVTLEFTDQNDPNAIYLQANDNNGTGRFVVRQDATDGTRVGIGTDAPAEPLEVVMDVNDWFAITARNTNAGAAAQAEVAAGNNVGTSVALGTGSSAHANALLTDRGYIWQNGGTGLTILTDAASSDIRFVVAGTTTADEQLRITDGLVALQNSAGLATTNLGVEFTESDTNPTCAAGNYSIFADLSETKLKKCENGTVKPLASTGSTITTRLFPEYPGAVLVADTTNNSGQMTSDLAVEGNYRHTYYQWEASSASLQDYDIYLKWQIPSTFTGWKSGVDDALIVDIATETTGAADNVVDVYVYKDGSAAAAESDTGNVSAIAGDFGSDVEGTAVVKFDDGTAGANSLGDLAFAAGDTMIIRIVLQSKSNNYARVGTVTLKWND